MLKKHHILTILWLALLSSPLVYADSCTKDSIVNYDKYGNPISVLKYMFDEKGREILVETKLLSNDQITSGGKTSTSYDNSGNEQSKATWSWNIEKQKWDGIDSTYTEYSTDGKILEESYSWSYDDDNWAKKYKSTYTFENGKQTSRVSYVGDISSWIPNTKDSTKYENGKVVSSKSWSSYDTDLNMWIGKEWRIYKYDSQNHTILFELYYWENMDWVGNSKTETVYNGGKITSQIQYNSYNVTTRTWIPSYWYKYEFDQYNNQTLNEQYLWNNGIWVGQSKTRAEYTAFKSDPIMTATFQWDSISASFIGVDSIRTASDEAKNQILDERYTYNVTSQSWQGTLKEEKIYDDAKNIISKKTYQWLSTQWIYATKDSSAFDANKNKILEEHYTWDTSDNYWVGTGEKHVSEYTNNMETLQEVYIWDTEDKDWTYKSKIIKEFDGTKLTLDEEYALVGAVLKGTKKEKYAYNAKGETVLTVKYSWLHDDVWQGADSILANYDTRKNKILDERYTYNVTNQSWQGASKWEAAFDAAKNQTMDAQYEWDATNSTWVGTSKKEYGFNADKQQVMFATYKWQGGQWVGTQKEERELDDEGREILVASYKWSSNKWVGKSRVVTTYYKDKLIATLANYDWKSNKWEGKDSTLYTYNAADLETSKIVMLYQTSAWVNSTKLEQIYNATNVLAAKYNFIWQNNQWQPIDKWEAHFDLAGRMDLDSTMLYQNNAWIYLNRNTNTYDTQDRLTLIMTENWENGIPSTGSKTENTYGEFGLTNTLTSEMQSGTWVELTKKDNTYNISGQLTQTLDQENTISGWQTTHLYQATYDGDKQTLSMNQLYENGLVVSGERIVYEYTSTENIETTSSWEGGGWVEQTRIGYYQSGNLSIETHYVHDGTQWIGNTKVETTTMGKNKEIATYQWQSGWVGITKTGTYYDEYEDETTASWNWKNNTWMCDTKKGESKYDNGKTKSQTTYKIVSNTFVFNSRVEYEYGTGDKDITTANYTYNTTSQSWQGVSKSGVTYNGANKTSETTYTWLTHFTWQPYQMKEYEYGSHQSDLTTAIYSWNTSIPDWVGVSKSGVTYASSGKQASEFSYVWGTTAAGQSDWLPVSKTEWEYGSGKDNAKATYKGVDTAWVGISKYAEKYTEHGDSLGFYTYCWKNGAWGDSLKQEFEYDDHNNVISHLYQQWKNNSWSTLKASRQWKIQYNENDSIILDAHWKWSGVSWVGDGNMHEYTYDQMGRLIFHQESSPNGYKNSTKEPKWKVMNTQEWTYDEMGRTTKYVYQMRIGSVLSGIEWWEKEYGEDGVVYTTTTYDWSNQYGWYGSSKTKVLYNELGDPTLKIEYKWLKDTTWIEYDKIEYIYDKKNRLIEKTTSTYDTAWCYTNKLLKVYDAKDHQILFNQYTWVDGDWFLISTDQDLYDSDPLSYKIRREYDASWLTNGEQLSHSDRIYYYACDPKFTITVNTQEEGIGEVTGGGVYTYYARPKIAAIETPGCNEFKQWSDGDTLATRRIIVTEDKTYTASFTPVLRTIRGSVTASGGGSVSVAIKKEE